MQCPCGAETRSADAVKSALKARLEFLVCSKCGRAGDAELYIRDTRVSFDLPGDAIARRQFESLDAESAQHLYDTVTALQDALSGGGADQLPLQAELF